MIITIPRSIFYLKTPERLNRVIFSIFFEWLTPSDNTPANQNIFKVDDKNCTRTASVNAIWVFL